MAVCCCSGEARRTVLWMSWVVNFVVTSIFYILSFCTCANLVRSYKLLNIEVSNEIWRAPVAASLLGGLLVLLFNILSCAILIRKSVNRAGPGMGYGFVCAFCFCLAFFCLLCGLVLDGFSDVVRDQLEVKLAGRWTQYNTGEFAATTGFAYICFVMFMLFFVALLMFQGAVAEELSTLPTLRPGAGFNPYARMAVPAAMESQGAMPSGMMVNPVYAPYPLAMDPAAAAAAAALIQGGGLGLGGAKVPLPGAAGVREQVPSAAALGADPAGAL